ncbi:MAG: HEAT repeat domain-containing protein [Verrucomicrobia bacterium]|nr:HEAT repeat domain-containing protein [Verrucomicrobiota bacterium]|tara:strand:+ start:16181 stop:17767 length:1587 start_codon:yes stop_codon:yes gene_type:complete
MSEDLESNQDLSIRCPACRQRFKVDEGLMERMVECGGCDTRFRINDEVIIRSKKFYPGERAGLDLNRFKRVPLSAAAVPEGMETMRYADFNHPEQLGPTPPLRVIAGIAGAGMMIITALLFLFSGGSGGAFSGMELSNKLVIGGFISILGFVLLLYANPTARLKAVFFGILMAAGVICIPLFVKGDDIIREKGPEPMVGGTEPLFPVEAVDPLEVLKERFGTKPLESERSRLEEGGGVAKAYGVYLTNLVQRNMYTARDYLIREILAAPSSHPYPRDDGNYLMLLTGVEGDLETVASIAGKLGSVVETHPDLGVIVVRVDNEQFVAGSAEKLNDASDPAFYQLNMRELMSIDIDRVERAVERFAAAEPKIYRTDISRMLVELMGKPGVRFHGEIARALLSWAEDTGSAGKAALQAVKRYTTEDIPVPATLVELVVKEQTEGAAPVIHELWLKKPNLWQSGYVKFGEAIEQDVLEQVNAESATLRRSALVILGEIGSEKSLPELRKLVDDEEPSIRVLAQRAVAQISGR